jgi:hypothetical protein
MIRIMGKIVPVRSKKSRLSKYKFNALRKSQKVAVLSVLIVVLVSGFFGIERIQQSQASGYISAIYAMSDYNSDGARKITITLLSDTSRWDFRAYISCWTSVGYGPWVYFKANTNMVSTATCPSYVAVRAGFQYSKTYKYAVQCWFNGGRRTGTCHN